MVPPGLWLTAPSFPFAMLHPGLDAASDEVGLDGVVDELEVWVTGGVPTEGARPQAVSTRAKASVATATAGAGREGRIQL
ncbi:MAG: hypothetical protein ACRDX8_00420 [Acidimicrobiales bacterium]